MPKFTQKYTIIQLFEPVPEGTQFAWTNWPLHSTVVDVFAIDWDVPLLIEKLAELSGNHPTAQSVATEERGFGPEGQTQVILLKKTDDLVALHLDLIEMLSDGGFAPNNPEFAGEGFLPHSTIQKHARLHKGDQVTFDALTLIDMFPGEDPYQRKVVKTIRIGDN